MPNRYRTPDYSNEPNRRFYPTQETPSQPRIPSAPTPFPVPKTTSMPQSTNQSLETKKMPGQRSLSRHNTDDIAYLTGRHPVLLQRLYNAADSVLTAYPEQDFIYDAYPDYVSLHLMRDRILRETPTLTEDFLQAGCPIDWLNLLTDSVITEQLCRMRCQRNPSGVANTTSLQSVSRS